MNLFQVGPLTYIDPEMVEVVKWSEKKNCPVVTMDNGEKVYVWNYKVSPNQSFEVKKGGLELFVDDLKAATGDEGVALGQDATALKYEEPREPGWYAYSGGAQTMIFHLRDAGGYVRRYRWSVHHENGSSSDCYWGYIEQALGVWTLEKIA